MDHSASFDISDSQYARVYTHSNYLVYECWECDPQTFLVELLPKCTLVSLGRISNIVTSIVVDPLKDVSGLFLAQSCALSRLNPVSLTE